MLSRDASMSSFRATAAAWRMASRLAVASRRGARVVGAGMTPSYASCTPVCNLAMGAAAATDVGRRYRLPPSALARVEQPPPEALGDRRGTVADAELRVDAEQV